MFCAFCKEKLCIYAINTDFYGVSLSVFDIFPSCHRLTKSLTFFLSAYLYALYAPTVLLLSRLLFCNKARQNLHSPQNKKYGIRILLISKLQQLLPYAILL